MEIVTNEDIFNLLLYGFVFIAFAAGVQKGGQR